MKAQHICCIIVLVVFVPVFSYGGVVFSVKPGTGIQSSQFGLKMGKLTPYIGADLIAIGAEGKYTETDWSEDWASGGLFKSRDETLDLSGSATLIIPHVGLRLFLSHKELRPYFYGGFFKSFAFVNVKGSNVTRYYNPQGQITDEDKDDMALEGEEEKAVKDILSPWGLFVGFGVEYPFSKHFSVAGEYGLRMFFTSAKYEHEDSDDYDGDGIDDWREEWDQELSGSLKMSQAAISLIYYF